jgi:hypothetical protein
VASNATLDPQELPWAPGDDRRAARLELVILWSLDEPHRVGESAAVDAKLVLGRGAPEPWAPHARFRPWRPGTLPPATALTSPRISRAQLQLSPRGDHALRVENIGRNQLLVNGEERQSAEVEPGDTLTLRNALVLLVIRREADPPAIPSPAFPFGQPDPWGMVGESAAAWQLRSELRFAAGHDHHVLLQGESGVGKEIAAAALHAMSKRGARALVSRNAATLPEGLVDAELFGTARNYPNVGAPERPGLIGEADGSTLFLDEIGELPAALQAHLLRVLDAGGAYQRLGDARPRRADLRVVAATPTARWTPSSTTSPPASSAASPCPASTSAARTSPSSWPPPSPRPAPSTASWSTASSTPPAAPGADDPAHLQPKCGATHVGEWANVAPATTTNIRAPIVAGRAYIAFSTRRARSSGRRARRSFQRCEQRTDGGGRCSEFMRRVGRRWWSSTGRVGPCMARKAGVSRLKNMP